MREFELRLQFAAAHEQALRAAMKDVPWVALSTHHFDTLDSALFKRGISLSLCQTSAHWVQTLAFCDAQPGGVSSVQLGESKGMPSIDIFRHRDSPFYGELQAAIAKSRSESGLVERFQVQVVRRSRLKRRREGQVDVVCDIGELRAGSRAYPIRELRTVLRGGSPLAFLNETARWQQQFGMWLQGGSVVALGTALARGHELNLPVKSRAPEVAENLSAASFAKQVVASCLNQVLANASAIAAETSSNEHIHQLRVALRRLRIAVEELAELNAGIDPGWIKALAPSFQLLGATRDHDVLRTVWQEDLVAAGAPELPPLSAVQAPCAAEIVRAAEFQATLMTIALFTQGASQEANLAFDGSVAEALGPRLEELHRSIKRAARKFAELGPEHQHRIRRRVKRLRYLAEFMGPLYGRKRVNAYLDQLKPAQDVLGRLNDAAVAWQAFLALPEESAGKWFAVGWFAAQRQGVIDASALALKAAGRGRRFWHEKPKPA